MPVCRPDDQSAVNESELEIDESQINDSPEHDNENQDEDSHVNIMTIEHMADTSHHNQQQSDDSEEEDQPDIVQVELEQPNTNNNNP